MHNESLYFLCAADDRWCRAYGVNSDGIHCTAFVRVYDYRVSDWLLLFFTCWEISPSSIETYFIFIRITTPERAVGRASLVLKPLAC